MWNGFQDVSGAPLYYQVRIKENGTVLGEEEGWNNIGKLQQATLENITVSKNILHMVEVRSYAVIGLMSEAVSEMFSIVPLAPTWNSKCQNCFIYSLLMDHTHDASATNPASHVLHIFIRVSFHSHRYRYQCYLDS